MADNSKIEWTTHTFNPWWGCARVSPACKNCYADAQAQRYGHQLWRRKGDRRMLSEANWAKPLKWNRDAERAGVPAKVFCASMADVFEDHPQLDEPRKRLWDVIDSTPWLQWQLLTKRPENVSSMAPWGDSWPANVWLGTSVENQRFADQRIPILLLEIPAKVKFLSCEPLLGPVDLGLQVDHSAHERDFVDGMPWPQCLDCSTEETSVDWTRPAGKIDWVIVGGESGPKSRPTELAWARSIVEQCRSAGVAPFVKQLGAVWAKDTFVGGKSVASLGDRKGGLWEYWPADLRVREFPEVLSPVKAG